MSEESGRAISHSLEVDMGTSARQDPAFNFAVAGLAVASRWEMDDGEIYRVETVNRYETREHGQKTTQPRIIFENGSSWVGGQFIADVKSGALNPEDPAAFSLAAALNHPRFQDTEGDDGE